MEDSSRERRLELERAKQAGYRKGRDNHWPDWMPPVPPNAVAANLIQAALKLRNAVDAELATLDPKDEWQTKLGGPMDELTEALEAVTCWLKRGEPLTPRGPR